MMVRIHYIFDSYFITYPRIEFITKSEAMAYVFCGIAEFSQIGDL